MLYSALGASFFSEILCRESGLSGGRGGSMHLVNESVGFYGSVPIVAGTVPLAVGAGFTSKMMKNNSVSVAYFGDGAIEEGVVHECLNLAQINKLPVLFVLENNLFSSHLHISQRQTDHLTFRFSKANNIKSYLIDGNNAAFGYVVEGNEILNKLDVNDQIISITIEDGIDRFKSHA